VTPARFRQLEVDPFRMIGKRPYYSIDSVVSKRLEREAVPGRERPIDRLKDLKAREMELDLAEREAALRRTDQVQDALNALGGEVVAQSRGIGQALRHELGLPAEAGDVIQGRVDQLLSKLSTVEADLGEPPGPASRFNGHGVGRQQ
jgi:hypothetical protein